LKLPTPYVNQQAERINQSFPDQADTRLELQNVLAEVQGNLGNNAQSLAIYEDVLATLKDNNSSATELAKTHTAIAGQLELQGQLQQALEEIEKAIELTPLTTVQNRVTIDARLQQATIFSELRRNSEAVNVLTTALQHREQILELPDGQAILGRLLVDYK